MTWTVWCSMNTSRYPSTNWMGEKTKMFAIETQSQSQRTSEKLSCLAMAQGLYMTASRTKCTRPALRRETSQQTLNATLATATTRTRICQSWDLLNRFSISFINGCENTGGTDLITVADQSICRLRPHLIWHVYNHRHRFEPVPCSSQLYKKASLFWDWVTFAKELCLFKGIIGLLPFILLNLDEGGL